MELKKLFDPNEVRGLQTDCSVKYMNNTRTDLAFINTWRGYDRRRRSMIPVRFSTTLLFIYIMTSVVQRSSAGSDLKQELQETLHNVQEVLSSLKSQNILKQGTTSQKPRFSADNHAHGFHEQTVTIPLKISHVTGEPVQHGRHFVSRKSSRETDQFGGNRASRSRRSANNPVNRDQSFHTAANFTFMAFGQSFHMHLLPYARFISPTFTLHIKGNVTEDIDQSVENVPRHCFYSGIMNSVPAHTAVVSLCGGMFGAFRVGKMEYLIEPHSRQSHSADLQGHGENYNEEMGTKLHRIYRRGVRRVEKRSSRFCANDGIHEKQRNDVTSSSYLAQERHGMTFVNSSRIIHKKLTPETMSYDPRHRQFLSQTIKTEDIPHTGSKVGMNTGRKKLSVAESTKTKSRQKRYVSYPRYVETMVVADNGMLRAHGVNLQHYILTLMAIVHQVYLDASIKNQINIVFVKLIIIDHGGVSDGPQISPNAHECLRNFCQWQADENDPDDSHPNHHDTAILITRQDICRSKNSCDTLGLAELGTMCDPLRSCSINEDNGLSTAFTIAHELGHEFNAPHDNSEKCLTPSGNPEGMNVMSPTLDHKSKPWSWSNCSARYITNFLDYGNGLCLLDAPPQRKLPLPIEKPGQIYDLNQQCSFVYGEGVTHCSFMNNCARLWCVSADRTRGCRTPHMPWADGTTCEPGKWCQKGLCVQESHHARLVSGGWGGWSKFGDCSRTCGGGVRISHRECNNPTPKDGGKYCVGKRKKFRSCNWQDCGEPGDFRASQCQSYNWSKYSHHLIKGIPNNAHWIPKYDGILLQDRCKLICQLKMEDQYGAPWYVLKPKVINGTPCGPDTNDICVEGICKRAGCDRVLNSNTKLDECGICGGDNSGCRTVKGVYNYAENEGYNIVVEIPAGCTNIIIEQRSFSYHTEDNNYLALKDSTGLFILNGNRNVVQFEHRVQKSSPTGLGYSYQFDYTGTDNVVERINSSLAILENITVLVLSAGSLMPPNIKYRYHIPLSQQITYSWDPYGPWSDCSRPCRGQTKREVLCARSGDGQIVADYKCHTSNRPSSIVRSCNTHCEMKWRIKSQECSARCGQGVLRFEYECIRITRTRGTGSAVDILRDSQCAAPKPGKTAVCRGGCLPTFWHYGTWSECNRKCGGGTQTRTAVCKDGSNVVQPSTACDIRNRLVSQICNVFACPQWVAGDFSNCLATCGNGVRRRRVWCRGPTGQVLGESSCTSLRKPPSTVKCHLAPCPTWKYEEWGKCSVTCGEGITLRSVHCTDYLGRHVDDEQCNESLRGTDVKSCRESECFTVRLVPSTIGGQSNISNHSTPVGRSMSDSFSLNGLLIRHGPDRSPTTRNYDDETSILIDVAVDRVRNNSGMQEGIPVWRRGRWTNCSATCDGGVRHRHVTCRDAKGLNVSEIYCAYATKPSTSELCNNAPCEGKWTIGPWSECTVSCGDGYKTRQVKCSRNILKEMCNPASKPVSKTTCIKLCPGTESSEDTAAVDAGISSEYDTNRITETQRKDGSFGAWRTQPWTECSSSCGSGKRKRAVVCLGKCDSSSMPTTIELCDTGPCPAWRYGQWSSCSTSCGSGVSTRTVQCVLADGSVTSDTRCNIMKRPVETISCGTGLCLEAPLIHRWKTMSWSACSVTCGRGLKSRKVICVDSTKNYVLDDMCASVRRKKPSEVRKCRTRRRCPRWQTGKWNKCSATCGSGVRLRRVSCRYQRKTLPDLFCNIPTKPEDVENCNEMDCDVSQWGTTPWSSCSVSCGEGTMRRQILCVDTYGLRMPDDKCVAELKPSATQSCRLEDCKTYWKVDAWSECSTTCGSGLEHRKVRCVYMDRRTQLMHPATNCNDSARPPSTRACIQNSCEADVQWRVGRWSECSATCGRGMYERQVICFSRINSREVPGSRCENDSAPAPERTARCIAQPCVPTSCRYAQRHYNTITDGEYTLQIRGKAIQIYCKDMQTRFPTEYLSLSSGQDENFSEIYSYSLNNSETCPKNGSRHGECVCKPYSQSGKTVFSKIRFDVRSMKVIMNDFEFAFMEYGRPVPFGVAGDCYSKVGCPQGQFRISLRGTGLIVDGSTVWSSYGKYAVQRVQKSHGGQSVTGECGGYCGQCRPDPIRGLKLSLRPNR